MNVQGRGGTGVTLLETQTPSPVFLHTELPKVFRKDASRLGGPQQHLETGLGFQEIEINQERLLRDPRVKDASGRKRGTALGGGKLTDGPGAMSASSS